MNPICRYLLAILACFICLGALTAFAEPVAQDQAAYQEFLALKNLKQDDPAAYRQAIQAKKEGLQKKIDEVKRENPQAFESFQEKEPEFRKKRLEYFKTNHPKEFQDFAERRIKHAGNVLAQRGGQYPNLVEKKRKAANQVQAFREKEEKAKKNPRPAKILDQTKRNQPLPQKAEASPGPIAQSQTTERIQRMKFGPKGKAPDKFEPRMQKAEVSKRPLMQTGGKRMEEKAGPQSKIQGGPQQRNQSAKAPGKPGARKAVRRRS